MALIETDGLTKDYGRGRGVFGVSFAVAAGQTLGFLGPNGAGKTTTLRQLMGFVRPDAGTARIGGHDCFAEAAAVHRQVGYLPGELACPDDMTGKTYLQFCAGMYGAKDRKRIDGLVERFELGGALDGRIRKMSKGTKQKLGIVCAFFTDAPVLLLDEPTSGLDPLMQNRFVQLILEEKARGKTILLSSHMFEEVERTCDAAAILRAGRLAAVEQMDALRRDRRRVFEVQFDTPAAAQHFAAAHRGLRAEGSSVRVAVAGRVDGLVKALAAYPVADLSLHEQGLEELFLQYYRTDAPHAPARRTEPGTPEHTAQSTPAAPGAPAPNAAQSAPQQKEAQA